MDDHCWKYLNDTAFVDNSVGTPHNYNIHTLNISKIIFAQVFICMQCGSKKIMKDDKILQLLKPNDALYSSDEISCAQIIMEQVLE